MSRLVHLPRVLRRAAADAGLLAVSAVVVALSAGLAVAVPVLGERAADATTAAAVVAEADRSTLVVEVALGEYAGEAGLDGDSVSVAARAEAGRVELALPGVFGRPVAALTSARLDSELVSGEQGLTSLRLVAPWRDGPPAVRWATGGPATAPEPDDGDGADEEDDPGDGGTDDPDGEQPALPVGLAEPVAQALGVSVGDRLPASVAGEEVPVVLSGTFVPVDADDPVWTVAAGLLEPRVAGSGPTAATDVAALVDGTRVRALTLLPSVRPVFTSTQRVRTAGLSDATAVATARAAAALEAGHQEPLPGLPGEDVDVRTGLDDVLLAAHERVGVTRAQAAVLLVALLVAAASVLVLAASLLAARRAPGLAVLRARGAPLSTTAAEAALEAGAIAVVAAAVGACGGLLAVGGAGPLAGLDLRWLLPLLLLAAAAPAVGAVRAAGAAAGGRRPAARGAAAGLRVRDGARRALAVEAALVAAAALSLAAVVQGGAGGAVAQGPLPAAAVVLTSLAAALLVRRAAAPVLPVLHRRAAAGDDAVRLASVARLVGSVRRVVPAVTLVVAVGCATTGLVLASSLRGGMEKGSWQAVGADAVLTGPPGGVDALAPSLVAAPGVSWVGFGRVEEAQLLAVDGSHPVRLVAADPAELRDLLDAGGSGGLGPERTAAQLSLLAGDGSGALPVLLSSPLTAGSSGGGSGPGTAPALRWAGGDVDVTVVGDGPRWGGDGEVTAVVDRDALARAGGVAAPATTAWLLGPGAAGAARTAASSAAGGGQQVALRSAWLAERADAPATRALLRLTAGAAVALVALAALAVALEVVGSAPSRRRDAAVLELLGARRGAARRLALAEVVPPALGAAVLGLVVGAALAGPLRAALGLRSLTGQLADPALSPSWDAVLPAAALVVTAVAVALAATLDGGGTVGGGGGAASGRGRARGGARLR